jgi:ComF family protein
MPLAAVIDALLPPACAACGRVGAIICPRCRAAFRPPSDPADRFIAADAGVVVGEALTVVLAALAYEGPVRRALGRLKYAGAARVADPLAQAALPTLERLVALTGAATLVPIPVHPARRRERGYNQAALLAAALSRGSGLPVAEPLSRARETARQHHLGRAARLANLRDAFAMAPGARAPPTAILVDDILTTSATMEACAAALRGGGASAVCGLAIAREV